MFHSELHVREPGSPPQTGRARMPIRAAAAARIWIFRIKTV
jgi:hypothetical protein